MIYPTSIDVARLVVHAPPGKSERTGRITVVAEDGVVVRFEPDGECQCIAPADLRWR